MSKTQDSISVTQLKNFIFEFWAILLKKKVLIVIVGLSCGIAGLVTSFIVKPKYTAVLTFAVQEDEKAGGISSIASQFGISLGGGSNGAFGGDNIYELLLSRHLIEKSLLCPTNVNGKQTNLISLYIDTYGLGKKWSTSEKKEVRELSFPVDQPRKSFTRAQDSIVIQIYKRILKEQLTAEKRSKKLSIGDVTFISQNENLSCLFLENLIRETSQFYVETKTKTSRNNYNLLKHQTDSVKEAYERALSARASLADNNLNVVRQIASVNMMKRQTDLQILTGAYIEMTKNLEMLKLDISRETPLVEVIDHPIAPLKVTRIGRFIGLGVGGLVGGFLAILSLLISYTYRKIKEKLD